MPLGSLLKPEIAEPRIPEHCLEAQLRNSHSQDQMEGLQCINRIVKGKDWENRKEEMSFLGTHGQSMSGTLSLGPAWLVHVGVVLHTQLGPPGSLWCTGAAEHKLCSNQHCASPCCTQLLCPSCIFLLHFLSFSLCLADKAASINQTQQACYMQEQ